MKKRSLLLFISTLFISFYAPGQLHAQVKPDSAELKMDEIFTAYNHSKGPGCAVAIIKNGQVLFKKGYGMANLEYDIPVSTATIFDVASVSKQFTGLAISILVHDGKIDLDEDIKKYLPDVPAYGQKVTVRQLLHHTSGIRDCFDALVVAGWRWNDVFSFQDVMKMVKYQKELNFKPGTQFSYCNTEYNLLQAIVEKVSGKTYPEWTDEHIFKPIGMDHSCFMEDFSKIIKNLANPYDVNGTTYTRDMQQSGTMSMFSSIDDLSKWVIHFQQALADKDPVYVRMVQQGLLYDGTETHYGFGLEIGEDHGLKTISHTGAWGGYRANIKNYPDQKFALVTLSNAADNELSGKYASAMATVFLKGEFKADPNSIDKIKAMPTIKPDANLLNKYAGTFKLAPPAGITLNFTVDSGQLTGHNGPNNFPLEAKTNNTFFIALDNSSITFVNNKTGVADAFIYKSTSMVLNGSRVITGSIKFSPGPEQLKQNAGTYYNPELETQYTVIFENGKLVIHHFRRGDFELSANPSAIDAFTGDPGEIHFFKNKSGKISGFDLSAERIRNIRFEKKY
ncbi:MAG: beta-lactamase [Mucilaginibacter sp.]|nr:beta-lactamase [Mucilaginibacter sp.]